MIDPETGMAICMWLQLFAIGMLFLLAIVGIAVLIKEGIKDLFRK